jgi:hypothetical protein
MAEGVGGLRILGEEPVARVEVDHQGKAGARCLAGEQVDLFVQVIPVIPTFAGPNLAELGVGYLQ